LDVPRLRERYLPALDVAPPPGTPNLVSVLGVVVGAVFVALIVLGGLRYVIKYGKQDDKFNDSLPSD
jgi:hypothetical protein